MTTLQARNLSIEQAERLLGFQEQPKSSRVGLGSSDQWSKLLVYLYATGQSAYLSIYANVELVSTRRYNPATASVESDRSFYSSQTCGESLRSDIGDRRSP